MKVNYCLPIIKKTFAEVDHVIREHETVYNYFEVWLDYLEGASNEEILGLADRLGERLILLYRRQNLEPMLTPAGQRQSMYAALSGKRCYLDLDLRCQQEDLAFLKEKHLSIPLIVSYHDYAGTPEYAELCEILNNMGKHKPQIYKISATCNSRRHTLRLLNFVLDLQHQNIRYIILGMGEHGIITRVFATLWGNEMIFAPVSADEKSAPGQLTRTQLEAIFNNLPAADSAAGS